MYNYSSQDLLMLLQVLATDYNIKPTQRAVLTDSRLPTHHTYRDRFGSLDEALKQAGVFDFPRVSMIHEIWGEAIRSRFDDVEEWLGVGTIKVNYVGYWGGKKFLIDIIDNKYIDESARNRVLEMREFLAKEEMPNATYLQMTSLLDIELKLPR